MCRGNSAQALIKHDVSSLGPPLDQLAACWREIAAYKCFPMLHHLMIQTCTNLRVASNTLSTRKVVCGVVELFQSDSKPPTSVLQEPSQEGVQILQQTLHISSESPQVSSLLPAQSTTSVVDFVHWSIETI